MNQLDPIEKQFREGLEAYQDVAPSAKLYRRIEWSLFKRRFGKNQWKKALVLLLFLLCTVWCAFSIFKQRTIEPAAQLAESYIQNPENTRMASAVMPDAGAEAEVEAEPLVVSEVPVESKENSASTSGIAKSEWQKETSPVPQKSEAPVPYSAPSDAPPVAVDASPARDKAPVLKQEETPDMPYSPTVYKPEDKSPDMYFPLNRGVGLLSYETKLIGLDPLPARYRHTYKQLYSEVLVGMSLSPSSISTTHADWKENVDYRSESETARLSHHLGVNVRYHYKNWFVQSGLHHYTFRDKVVQDMEMLQVNPFVTTILSTTDYYSEVITGYIHSPIDSIPVFDLVLDSTVVTEQQETYYDSTYVRRTTGYTNTISYLEIPLMLGYEFSYRSMFVDVSAGFAYSRRIDQQVQYPNRELSQLTDPDVSASLMRNHSLSMSLGLGLGYRLSNSTSVILSPVYQYQLQSNLTKDHPVVQRYQHLRLSAGLRFKM